jgi:hypothetical protein
MELTFIGIIQIVIGTYVVLAGSVRSALIFLVISAIFDDSAAIALPGLGGSSIPPVQFALLFTTLRILAPKGGYLGFLPDAVSENKWLIFFVIYGMVTAYLAPRMFGDMVDVFPMRPLPNMGPFDTIPLKPTSQNLTSSFYLLGALFLGISSYISCRTQSGTTALVSAILLASWLHVTTGIVDLATRGTPFEALLAPFRNGGYAMLDHTASGFIRIRGTLAEASTYAGIGFTLFLANVELWYRSIRTRATGFAALALALILVFSTASTAYVALGAYALFFVIRGALFPSVVPNGKFLKAAIALFSMIFVVSALIAFIPSLPLSVYELIVYMTVEKSGSFSGQQRFFWALQGWNGFVASFGIGIGPGSFRSSSIFMAILGSTGIVGIITFILYLKSVAQLSKKSTWSAGLSDYQSIGGALAVAAVLSLVPAAISSPDIVPNALFSIMAGAAIASRSTFANMIPETAANIEAKQWQGATGTDKASVT